MTIEYKDSKRIVALSTDITNTPTYEDDFSSDNKTGQANSSGVFTVDTGDERIEGTINRSGTNRNLTWDLQTIMGEAIDSTAFVLTFKLQILTNSNSTGTSGGTFVALTSLDQNYGSQSGQDSVSIQFENQGSGGRISGYAVNGGVLDSNADWGDQGVIAQLKTFYVKFAKDGDTTTITIAYDEGFTDLYHTVTKTTSDITGLRYFKIQNYTVAVSSYNGTTTFAVDDLKVYNGVTSLSSKPTDVQDNSLLVQKDTASRYWFESELAPTYEDDFTSDNSVDQDASKISVNTAQERWDFNIVNDQTNDSSSIDITTALSDSKWVMDFDYTWTSLSGTTNVNTSFFGISNSNGTVPSQTAQDHIGVRLQTGSGFSIAGCHSNNGTMQSGLSATFTTIPSVTTLYFRIVRTSTTSMTVKIYTTSARTTVSEEKTVAVSASTTGLRYVKISPYEGTNGGSNTEVGYVKNLKIYNAVTSVTPATWINEFGVSDGLMFGGVSTSSYANFSDSQSWNGVSWTAGGSLTGARQRGASAGTGSTSARYVNGYNSTPAPYPNSNRNESYNGTAWTSDTVHPQSVNNKSNGGCGTVDSMIVTGGHQNGTGDVNNYYKWTGSWTSIAQGITGSGGSISGTLTSALMTKSTSAQTWNGSSWTSSTATSTSRTFSPASGTSSTSGFRVFGTYANPFISTSESWNGTAWTARGSAPAGRVEAGCIPASTDSMMTLGGQQYHGASGSDIYSTDVYEYRKGTFTTGASFNNGRRSSGGAGS